MPAVKSWSSGPSTPTRFPCPSTPTPDEPKNFVERSLKEHNQALDRLSGQLDELLDLVREGTDEEGQVVEMLDVLRQYMRPRPWPVHRRPLRPLPGPRGSHQGARNALHRLEDTGHGGQAPAGQAPELGKL